MNPCFLLHGCGIFFQFCSGCGAISYGRYHLAEIFLADISCGIDSLAVGLLVSICFYISMRIQSYKFFYQSGVRGIACEYKDSESVIRGIKDGFLSGIFVSVTDPAQHMVTFYVDDLSIC